MINDRRITITTGASRRATQWLPQTLMLSEFYMEFKSCPNWLQSIMEKLLAVV